MPHSAIVSASRTEFRATPSDGQCVNVSDLHALARTLFSLGVPAHAVRFEWHAGQQVALAAEIRSLMREYVEMQPAGSCGDMASTKT